VIAKIPYALLSFVVENQNLQERNEYHGYVLQNIDLIAVKKIDEITKEKNISS